jgi:hypothetical protein
MPDPSFCRVSSAGRRLAGRARKGLHVLRSQEGNRQRVWLTFDVLALAWQVADGAVDEFADDVGVAGMPCGLFDHVCERTT